MDNDDFNKKHGGLQHYGKEKSFIGNNKEFDVIFAHLKMVIKDVYKYKYNRDLKDDDICIFDFDNQMTIFITDLIAEEEEI